MADPPAELIGRLRPPRFPQGACPSPGSGVRSSDRLRSSFGAYRDSIEPSAAPPREGRPGGPSRKIPGAAPPERWTLAVRPVQSARLLRIPEINRAAIPHLARTSRTPCQVGSDL